MFKKQLVDARVVGPLRVEGGDEASRPSRASTGWPSTSASTSTLGPGFSSHGARMKTARSGSSPVNRVEICLEAVPPDDRTRSARVP